MTLVDATDAEAAVPMGFVALSVNAYAVLAVSPVMYMGDLVVAVPAPPPASVYPVMLLFPVVGAVKDSVPAVGPVATKVSPVVVPGRTVSAVRVETLVDVPDEPEVPPAFVPVSENVYAVLAVSPEIYMGEAVVAAPTPPEGVLVSV